MNPYLSSVFPDDFDKKRMSELIIQLEEEKTPSKKMIDFILESVCIKNKMDLVNMENMGIEDIA